MKGASRGAPKLSSCVVWNPNAPRDTTKDFNTSYSICAPNDGDLYVDDGNNHERIQKWRLDASNRILNMNVSGTCFSLFPDINGSLSYSILPGRQVPKKLMNKLHAFPTTIENMNQSKRF